MRCHVSTFVCYYVNVTAIYPWVGCYINRIMNARCQKFIGSKRIQGKYATKIQVVFIRMLLLLIFYILFSN